MSVHFSRKIVSGEYPAVSHLGYPLCSAGYGGARRRRHPVLVSDWALVTCKNCLKMRKPL